jgi:hypothetical protein
VVEEERRRRTRGGGWRGVAGRVGSRPVAAAAALASPPAKAVLACWLGLVTFQVSFSVRLVSDGGAVVPATGPPSRWLWWLLTCLFKVSDPQG